MHILSLSCKSLLPLLLSLFPLMAFNQEPALQLRSGEVNLENRSLADLEDRLTDAKRGQKGERYVIIQWERLPGPDEQRIMEKSGISLLYYVPDKAHLVRLDKEFGVESLRGLPYRSFLMYTGELKLDPSLSKDPGIVMRLMPGTGPEAVLSLIPGLHIVDQRHLPEGHYRITIPVADRIALAELPEVLYLYTDPGEPMELREYSEAAQRVSWLKAKSGYGLSGQGVSVGVGDGGYIGTHIDLNGHILDLSSGNNSSHAAHVSGIVAGNGLLDPSQGEGMAPQAFLISQNFSEIINFGTQYRRDYEMVITNNSYGNQLGNCDIAGDYNFFSEAVDRQILENGDLLHVFAAGNDGNNDCAPYSNGYGTILSAWQTAKNTLVVGNINHLDNLRPSSSKGPTKDGRLKPEVVAVGTGVLSTNRNNNYRRLSGTSMAAPQVSGIGALLIEFYRQLHGTNPPSGLLKAAIANSADDLGNPGPDYLFGFGRVNAENAIKILEEERYESGDIAVGETRQFEIEVPPGQNSLKVMLYWHDPEAAPFSDPVLVNNLDLRVMKEAGEVWFPYVLQTLPDSVANPALTGEDDINNIEQVEVFFPEPGTYTITVEGTQVAAGVQPFFVTWDFRDDGMELKYPVGGEQWQPGEEQVIRWYSGLPEGERLLLDYSSDGGENWEQAGDTLIASQGLYIWQVPLEFTTEARVRLRSETFGIVSESGLINIIPIPRNFTADPACEGSAYLHWPVVPGIDSFAVYRLSGNQMVEIGITTDTFFTDRGAETGKSHWYSSAAIFNGKRGTRAAADEVVAGTLNCPWATDLKLKAFASRSGGMVKTSSAFVGQDSIAIEVTNVGSDTVENFTAAYRVGQENPVEEDVEMRIPPGESRIYHFTTTTDFSMVGEYNLHLWFSADGDQRLTNDSLEVVVRQVANDPVPVPFTEDFESAPVLELQQAAFAPSGLERLEYMEGENGRLRTFAGGNYAASGSRAITLDAYPSGGSGDHFALLTFNMEEHAGKEGLRMNFKFMHHEQQEDQIAEDRIWIRGSDTSDFIEVYDINTHKGERGEYIYERFGIDIPQILGTYGQSLTSSFQVALQQEGEGRTNEPGQFNGLSFDDIEFFLVENDLRPTVLNYPERISCELAVAAPLIEVENTGNQDVDSVEVRYRVNGGGFSEPVYANIAAGQTTQVELQPYDFSEYGRYDLEVAVYFESDSYRANDTLRRLRVYNFPQVHEFPYVEDFEENDGGWYAEGENSSWEWGVPSGNEINRAAEGNHAWVTNLEGDHNNLELSYLYSPCFDLSNMEDAWLSFAHSFSLEKNYDYLWVEYTDDEVNWYKMGIAGQGHNWYNAPGRNAWDDRSVNWHVASLPVFIHPITDRSSVRFRFVLDSDVFVTEEGTGIDMVHVYDYTPIDTGRTEAVTAEPAGPGLEVRKEGMVSARISPASTVAGNASGSAFKVATRELRDTLIEERIVLDTVVVDTMIMDSLVMDTIITEIIVFDTTIKSTFEVALSDGSQVYMPRSWHMEGALVGSARIGLYVTEREILEFMSDTCDLCDPPLDPFDLVVTQFSGYNEDSLLQNNFGADYLLHTEDGVSSIPYGDGYILEFDTDRLSEFYIHGTPLSNVNGGILDLNLVRQGDTVNVQWFGTHELDVLRYEVERSEDSFENEIVLVGTETGLNQPGLIQPYEIQTALDSLAPRTIWYRVKAVRENGDVFYTKALPLIISSVPGPVASLGWKLSPNPGDGRFRLEWQGQGSPEATVRIYDANGSGVYQRAIAGTTDFSLDLAAGVYYLRLDMQGRSGTKKIIIH